MMRGSLGAARFGLGCRSCSSLPYNQLFLPLQELRIPFGNIAQGRTQEGLAVRAAALTEKLDDLALFGIFGFSRVLEAIEKSRPKPTGHLMRAATSSSIGRASMRSAASVEHRIRQRLSIAAADQ